MVRPDNGGIEEGAGFIDFDGQRFEDPFPDAGLRPPVEPVVHGLPGTESLGEVAPGNTGPDAPDDRVDEVAVASLRARPGSYGEDPLNAFPLGIAQFMSAHGKC